MVQFFYVTQAAYNSALTNNKIIDDHLYFIHDTKCLYKGKVLIASSGEADADLIALENAILQSNKAITANASSIESTNKLITAHIAVTDEMQKEIDALTSKIGPIETNLNNKADKTELSVFAKTEDVYSKSYIDGQLNSKANKTALNDYYTKTETDEEINVEINRVLGDYYKKSETFSKTEINNKLNEKVNTSTVEGISSKVNTLIGSDSGKSVRSIANDELAKQLIASDAQEALDTLEEIARWIQDHPNDAADMNQAIEALEAVIPPSSLPTGNSNIYDYIQKQVNALNNSINGVDSKVSANTTAIGKKVDTTTFNALKQLVEANEDSIKANADTLSNKADRTELESINNSITSLSNENSAQNDKITAVITEVYGTKATTGKSRLDKIEDGTTTVKKAESAGSATSATTAGSATKATQDASGNVITSTYETKTDAASKLANAQTYAEEQAAAVQANVDALKYAGSSSVGGPATSAIKADSADTLNTDAGSVTNPVYFANGIPVKTTYTLGKSVPSNAVFTDTHHQAFLHAGSNTSTSNAATTNGNTYINIIENDARRSGVKITGSGATSVKSDANGVITISSTDTNTTYDAANGSSLGLVKTGGDAEITSGEITIVSGANHEHQMSQIEGLDNEFSEVDGKIPTQASVNGKVVSVKNSTGVELFNFTTQDTNTDTKVKQTVTTSNKKYPLLLAPTDQTTTTTTTSYFDSGVTLNPSTNTIEANISGNAATATVADSATKDGSGNVIASTYETQTHASSTYETKSNASSTYETKSDATTAKNRITSLEGTVASHTTTLSNYGTSISNNTTNIGKKANQTDMTKVINEIYGVKNGTIPPSGDSRITDLEELVGDKKVATQIADEIAKIVANAPENFDTLKEIADWITNDTIGATEMSTKISTLINEVYGVSNGVVPSGNSRIDTINSTINGHTSSINTLNENKATKTIVSNIIRELYGKKADNTDYSHDEYPTGASRLSSIDDTIESMNKTIEGHTQSISDINESLKSKASQTALDGQKERIDSLYTEVLGSVDGSFADSRLDKVIKKADDNAGEIETNADNINKNTLAISGHDTRIGTLETNLGTAQGNITDILGWLEWKTSM